MPAQELPPSEPANAGQPKKISWQDVALENSRGFWQAVYKLIDRGRIVSVLTLVLLVIFFVWGVIVAWRYPADQLPILASGVAARLAGSWSVIAFLVAAAGHVVWIFAYRTMRDTMRTEIQRMADEKKFLQEALIPAIGAGSSSRGQR